MKSAMDKLNRPEKKEQTEEEKEA